MSCPHQEQTLRWMYGEGDDHAAHVATCPACSALADEHADVLGALAAAGAACPQEDQTLRWMYGEVEGHEGHVATCPRCAALVDQHLDVLRVIAPAPRAAGVDRDAPAPPERPAASRAAGWRGLALAAALLLGVLAGAPRVQDPVLPPTAAADLPRLPSDHGALVGPPPRQAGPADHGASTPPAAALADHGASPAPGAVASPGGSPEALPAPPSPAHDPAVALSPPAPPVAGPAAPRAAVLPPPRRLPRRSAVTARPAAEAAGSLALLTEDDLDARLDALGADVAALTADLSLL